MSNCQPSDAEQVRSSAGHGLLLHQFFERAARRWPDEVAVDAPPGAGRTERVQVTYAELSHQSDALARLLQTCVTGECVVGILLPRNSALLYAAQLAVLKAGAAYTCLDPAFPDERVRDVLEDSGAVALLTDTAGLARVKGAAPGMARVFDAGDPLILTQERNGPLPHPPWLAPASLAYVIYTSGTTGRPKGVLIEHRSIANLVSSDLGEFQLSPSDRVGQSSSAAYDSSVEEIWMAFAAGATVVVMDDDTARLGPDLIPWLHRERITVFCPPPTLLRATGCAESETMLPDLKLLYVGGEALPRDVADCWARGRRLVNGYGPTECAVTSLRGDVEEGEPITIGQPVPGLLAWVLDETLTEVANGERGELCLGGLGLARGYWKRPELTAEKFVNHPSLGRLYRTGDLVHCDSGGRYHYHGRMDSQVKIRGYRIELGDIESRLAECAGVRAATCHVQDDGGNPILVAFIVPENAAAPPAAAALKSALEAGLPGYMVPARFGVVAELPTTVGGKLNRAALPRLDGVERKASGPLVLPRNSTETILAAAFRSILRLPQPISVDDDFFKELGGDSLSAALLVTLLRNDDATAWVTVRDLYESRTVAELAKRAPGPGAKASPVASTRKDNRLRGQPFLVTVAQTVWLLAVISVVSWVAYLIAFGLLPWLTDKIGLVPSLLLAPTLALTAFLVYTPLSVGFAVMMKRLLIGCYRPLRVPVWSGFFLRNWIVQQTVRLVPWRVLEGTLFQQAALRALGARIGQRVHIHRGVNLLQGGWDLLDIGNDATLSQDAEVRLVELDDGDIVVGSVSLGKGSTLDIHSAVGSRTVLETGACLTALSSLPPGGRIPCGERWDGIPAQPAGQAPAPPPLPANSRALTPAQYGAAMLLGRAGMIILLALPLQLLAIFTCLIQGLAAEDLWGWLFRPIPDWTPWVVGLSIVVPGVPLTLALGAALMRLLGRVPEGSISRWSLAYVRVWLKTDLVKSAGKWLSGTLFWPLWLRAAGMKVGAGCEISTIIDVVPEHVEIGAETFFADGIYLGGPRIHQGVVTLKKTRLGQNTFLGNHVVIPAGQQLPDDILLGVCTVADDTTIRTGTSWFGLPPFELPRREVVECDRRLTHEPSWIRYGTRVCWELLRFALPITPLLVFVAWLRLLAFAGEAARPMFLPALVPLVSLGAVGFLCLFVLALKWILLGRVRPGQHALWSCWCSRWDFLYVAWSQYAASALSKLEGSLLLSWYLRAMGMKLGARVVLGSGFAQVVDPDMIHIEDGATVEATYQAHTFEDRVLKIDHVHVRRWATLGSSSVPLYGADVGERTHVAPHSVIMKRERLLPGRRYEGAPTR
jgi:non-ribosomal peptide synthetase-like protein